MLSEEFRVNNQESTRILRQATPVATSLSTRPSTSTPLGNANERDGLSQYVLTAMTSCWFGLTVSLKSPFFDTRNMIIHGGEFNHILGNLVVNFRELCFVSCVADSQYDTMTQHQKEVHQSALFLHLYTTQTNSCFKDSRPNSLPLNEIHNNISLAEFSDQSGRMFITPYSCSLIS